MRAHFEKEARAAEPIVFIPEPTDMINAYNEHKTKLLQPVPVPPVLQSDPIQELVEQALRIQKSVRNKRHKSDVARLLVEHIEECGRLLKETL